MITKPWGTESILIATDGYVIKRLYVHEGERLSQQFHERKTETLMIEQGLPEIELSGEAETYGPSEIIHIPAMTVHRISAPSGPVTILEVSTPELDDVVRLEDDYGRTA